MLRDYVTLNSKFFGSYADGLNRLPLNKNRTKVGNRNVADRTLLLLLLVKTREIGFLFIIWEPSSNKNDSLISAPAHDHPPICKG